MKLYNLFDRAIANSAFPKVTYFHQELMKMGILRIILGIIVFVRFAEISYTLPYLDYSPFLIQASYGLLLVIGLFIIGFLTPLISLILLFSLVLLDMKFGTFTLGTAILQITLVPFILINSGQYYSVDRLICRKNLFLSKPIRFVYSFFGATSNESITRSYFLSFCIYAIISFAALLYHVQDSYWLGGITTKALLLNSYLCKHYTFFRSLDASFPLVLSFLSVSAGVFQSIFQFLMIPLVFFKLGRKFVFYWGMIFFLISLALINLSYLPYVEIILWIMVFRPIRKPSKPLEIFYDEHCNLCKRVMKIFKLINFNNRFVFLPLSSNTERIASYGIPVEDISSYMTGVYKEKIVIGYDVYLVASRINPILWPLAPIFFLGKISRIGPIVYNYIALRRTKFFGACELSYEDEIAKNSLPLQLSSTLLPNRLFFSYYVVLSICYFLFRFPFLSTQIEETLPFTKIFSPKIRAIAYFSGFDLPNVFNKTDLSMGDNWMELYRLQDGELELVPLIGKEGQRLSLNGIDLFNFSNHNSDALYFGTTLSFRRLMITEKLDDIMQEGQFGWGNLKRRIQYDFNSNGLNSEHQYLVCIYKNKGNDVNLSPADQNIYNKELQYKKWFLFDGKKLTLNKNEIDFIDN